MNKKICPRCKSENVKVHVTVMGESPEYTCNGCGYHGIIFPELKKLKLEIKNENSWLDFGRIWFRKRIQQETQNKNKVSNADEHGKDFQN